MNKQNIVITVGVIALLFLGARSYKNIAIKNINDFDDKQKTATASETLDNNSKDTMKTLEMNDTKEGAGPAVKSGDVVEVHYTGTLEDGTIFDSSLNRGNPFSFTVGAGQVIKGWDQGLVGMKVGGKRSLSIPGDLAYGANSPTPIIPPNATLLFDIELLKIK